MKKIFIYLSLCFFYNNEDKIQLNNYEFLLLMLEVSIILNIQIV